MADVKTKLGTEAQAISITLASLGSAAARESTAIDNRTNLFLDVLVSLNVKTGTGTIASDKAVYVYLAGTTDLATPTWPDAVTGSDAAITLNSPTQLKYLGTIYCPAQTTTYKGGPWSVAEKYGGTLPEEWSIIVQNVTGIALDSTEGSFKKIYQGIYASST